MLRANLGVVNVLVQVFRFKRTPEGLLVFKIGHD